jgi:hypothetical protein
MEDTFPILEMLPMPRRLSWLHVTPKNEAVRLLVVENPPNSDVAAL